MTLLILNFLCVSSAINSLNENKAKTDLSKNQKQGVRKIIRTASIRVNEGKSVLTKKFGSVGNLRSSIPANGDLPQELTSPENEKSKSKPGFFRSYTSLGFSLLRSTKLKKDAKTNCNKLDVINAARKILQESEQIRPKIDEGVNGKVNDNYRRRIEAWYRKLDDSGINSVKDSQIFPNFTPEEFDAYIEDINKMTTAIAPDKVNVMQNTHESASGFSIGDVKKGHDKLTNRKSRSDLPTIDEHPDSRPLASSNRSTHEEKSGAKPKDKLLNEPIKSKARNSKTKTPKH